MVLETEKNNDLSESLQKNITYLKNKGVPVEALIDVLARTYQVHWGKLSPEEFRSKNRDEIKNWLRQKGCSVGLAQAIQEIVRPKEARFNQPINEPHKIETVAKRLRVKKVRKMKPYVL